MKQYSEEEWENLCDGCGQCCLHVFIDDDTNEFFQTSVACEFLNLENCRCSVYKCRFERVPACTKITRNNVHSLSWLPETCAYKRVSSNMDLPPWHHLNSGRREDVHLFGISVKNRAVSGANIHPDDLENFIVD